MGSLLKVFYRWVLVIKATLDMQTHRPYFDVEVNTGHLRKATAVLCGRKNYWIFSVAYIHIKTRQSQ